MLCWWLAYNEQIALGEEILLKNLGIRCQNGQPQARLQFFAPGTVQIYRRELYEAMTQHDHSSRAPAMAAKRPSSQGLILGRYLGKEIYIGRDAQIQIAVMEIKAQQVRLGITAPGSVAILRSNHVDRSTEPDRAATGAV